MNNNGGKFGHMKKSNCRRRILSYQRGKQRERQKINILREKKLKEDQKRNTGGPRERKTNEIRDRKQKQEEKKERQRNLEKIMTEKENKENRIISQEKTYRQRKQIKQVQIKHQSKKKKNWS